MPKSPLRTKRVYVANNRTLITSVVTLSTSDGERAHTVLALLAHVAEGHHCFRSLFPFPATSSARDFRQEEKLKGCLSASLAFPASMQIASRRLSLSLDCIPLLPNPLERRSTETVVSTSSFGVVPSNRKPKKFRPPKQTCRNTQSMSLLGVKRTRPCAPHMSAFDPKRTLGLIGI
jgi:hypothetical protein